MLYSNKSLNYIGNDIARFYGPAPTCHPEIYVPVAMECLKTIFPGRVNTITGDCLVEVPKYAIHNDTKHIDLVHLDGHKATYETDFNNLKPLLKPDCYIVFDDTQQSPVQYLVDRLLEQNVVKRCLEFPKMDLNETYRHEIVQLCN